MDGERGDFGHRVQSFSYTGGISSADLLHTMVIIVNNNVYFKTAKTVNFQYSYYKEMISM